MHALRIAQVAAFALYCVAAGLLVLAVLASLLALVFSSGRLGAGANILASGVAFLAFLVASAVVTVVVGKIVHVVDRYGRDVGVVADKGWRFLVVTWVGTALAGLGVVYWAWECVRGRNRKRAREGGFLGNEK